MPTTLTVDRIQDLDLGSEPMESKAYPFIFLEHAQAFPGSEGAVEQIKEKLNVQRLPN